MYRCVRASMKISKRRQRKQKLNGANNENSFYTTNYSEYLRPENYSAAKSGKDN